MSYWECTVCSGSASLAYCPNGIGVFAFGAVSRYPKTGMWGKGSRLAFNTAVQQHIPLFVVTTVPPLATGQLLVEEGSLFGIVGGQWVVPRGVEVRIDEEKVK